MKQSKQNIPDSLIADFTMNGLCRIENNFIDDSTPEVQDRMNANFSQEVFSRYLQLARDRKPNYYGNTDIWLYDALKHFPISGKDVCIFGSANPWYEAVSIEFGARSCTVFEYSQRRSFDARISYLAPERQSVPKFSVALSISSFEHYGLGRYGDPLDPNGDLKAMHAARDSLFGNGILFLSVPVGKDTICFNAHRIYGKHRLSSLLDGWQILATFGFSKRRLGSFINTEQSTPYQPIFVLRPKQ